MKRFYKTVGVRRAGALFAVTLDERPLKTPAGELLVLRSGALAEAIAAEWALQGAEIEDSAMPLTRIANTAIDRVRADRGLALSHLEAFGRHDLVCYRASHPAALAAREAAAWDLPLLWVRTRHGIDLDVTTGVAAIPQPRFTLDVLEQVLAPYDEFALAALGAAAPVLKSLVLALMLADGRMSAAEVHAAANVGETFQAEQWGRDAEADARLAALLAELEAASQFLKLAKA